MRELGRLGFGAANLGNMYRVLDEDEVLACLEAAWDSGIRYFDTAPHYGLGLSEFRLGRFLATKKRSDYVISTKVGRLLRPTPNRRGRLDDEYAFSVPANLSREWDFSEAGVRASLAESLDRLGLDRVDIALLHDAEKHDLELADREAYPALAEMRDEGIVVAVGSASMSVETLARAADNPLLDILMIAGRLTLLEQPALAEVLPLANESEKTVVVAGVFNSGLLSTARPGAKSRYEYGEAPQPLVTRAQQIARVCESFDVALPTAALLYPFRIPGVSTVVMGTGRAIQVRENVDRMGATVPDELWDALRAEGLIPAETRTEKQ